MKTYFTTLLFVLGTFVFSPPSIEAKVPVLGTIDDYTGIRAEKSEQAKDIIRNLKEQLSNLGVSFEHSNWFAELDNETKKRAFEIIKNAKEGTISHEDAKDQLKELGVQLPKKKNHIFEGIDEETKEKAKDIFKQIRDGKLTKEEAKTKLEELGITMPKNDKGDYIENLDEETTD